MLLKRGPKRLVVKRGEYGSLYFDDEGVFAAPALILEDVADPTGAGDSFAGGLIGYSGGRGDKIDHADAPPRDAPRHRHRIVLRRSARPGWALDTLTGKNLRKSSANTRTL